MIFLGKWIEPQIIILSKVTHIWTATLNLWICVFKLEFTQKAGTSKGHGQVGFQGKGDRTPEVWRQKGENGTMGKQCREGVMRAITNTKDL